MPLYDDTFLDIDLPEELPPDPAFDDADEYSPDEPAQRGYDDARVRMWGGGGMIDLAKLRDTLSAATRGQWRIGRLESYEGDTGVAFRRVYFPGPSNEIAEAHIRGVNCDANAALIAMAHDLAAEVLALRAALDKAEADKAAAVEGERERCAELVKVFLEDEGISLQQISDTYRDAMASGLHQGRKMPKETAKSFARHFSERADAVYQMGEHAAAAIRNGGAS